MGGQDYNLDMWLLIGRATNIASVILTPFIVVCQMYHPLDDFLVAIVGGLTGTSIYIMNDVLGRVVKANKELSS